MENFVANRHCLVNVMHRSDSCLSVQGKGSVYLMAATLRPETMYGQTNCWVLPDGEYGAYAGPDGDVYVMAPRSARNLLWQVINQQADGEILVGVLMM